MDSLNEQKKTGPDPTGTEMFAEKNVQKRTHTRTHTQKNEKQTKPTANALVGPPTGPSRSAVDQSNNSGSRDAPTR